MSELSLHPQVAALASECRVLIDSLELGDPIRDGLEAEYHKLTGEAAKLSLNEANARLGGFRQLEYLVRQHIDDVNGVEKEAKQFPDSTRTVQARMPSHVMEMAREMGFSIEPSLLHNPVNRNPGFDPVSPTAKIVSYLRGLGQSDQPDWQFSPEEEGRKILEDLNVVDEKTLASMAVLFLSRYQAINAILSPKEHGSQQLIEFASGISPRGYQWARMVDGAIYVESDLPQLMLHKAKLVRDSVIDSPRLPRGLHHCRAIDVLDESSVLAALDSLDVSKPFTIVTEGLLLYFSSDEMHQFLSTVAGILEMYPQASWVTDFVTRTNLRELFESDPEIARAVKGVFSQVGRGVVPNNPFESDLCVEKALSEHGMTSDLKMPLRNSTHTMEFKNAKITSEQRYRIVGSRKIWQVRAQSRV